jgi:hypothetical protein
VAPVVGLVGTGRRGETRGRSGGARLRQRDGGAHWRGIGWGGGAHGVDGGVVGGDAVARRPARRTKESGEAAGNWSTRRREGGEHDGEAKRNTAEAVKATMAWRARTWLVGRRGVAAQTAAVRTGRQSGRGQQSGCGQGAVPTAPLWHGALMGAGAW